MIGMDTLRRGPAPRYARRPARRASAPPLPLRQNFTFRSVFPPHQARKVEAAAGANRVRLPPRDMAWGKTVFGERAAARVPASAAGREAHDKSG